MPRAKDAVGESGHWQPAGAGSGRGYSATQLPTGCTDKDIIHTITCKKELLVVVRLGNHLTFN